jgi:hypothetical protein
LEKLVVEAPMRSATVLLKLRTFLNRGFLYFSDHSGFGHGFNNPKEMRAATQSSLDWLNHYLWDNEIPKDSPILGSSERGQ